MKEVFGGRLGHDESVTHGGGSGPKLQWYEEGFLPLVKPYSGATSQDTNLTSQPPRPDFAADYQDNWNLPASDGSLS